LSNRKPYVLIIMDGLGINPRPDKNAVYSANTPVMDRLLDTRPNSMLSASGEDVGLMPGQMGDSNVGHLNMGAGRIVYQYMLRIRNAVSDGSFFTNPVLVDIMKKAASNHKKLHLLGLVSPGGVHSHSDQLVALLRLAKQIGCPEVLVHAFTDGRDVSPSSGKDIIAGLEATMEELSVGKIATLSGRYYAMDRDKRWERTKKAFDAMVYGQGLKASSGEEAVRMAYQRGESDEFILPTVIEKDGRPVGLIESGDCVLFFNFRADRARQLTSAFIQPDFKGFEMIDGRIQTHFTTMTNYDEDFQVPYAFLPQELNNTLGEIISKRGLKQFRVAETEKYAHVTFFFNGGIEEVFEGEERLLIPSPKVATYDLQPEMSAYPVCDAVVEAIGQGRYDLYIINFANCDMVGHTGIFDAAVKAVETVDTCIGRIIDAAVKQNGEVLVTADHGNAEQMVDYETGEEHTFHTSNPVPFIYVGSKDVKLKNGRLADVAPTILALMGIPQPAEMTGESLLVNNSKG
jgi:2,3-bisphosphoglycerate-independent phosphoglycerate mutase